MTQGKAEITLRALTPVAGEEPVLQFCIGDTITHAGKKCSKGQGKQTSRCSGAKKVAAAAASVGRKAPTTTKIPADPNPLSGCKPSDDSPEEKSVTSPQGDGVQRPRTMKRAEMKMLSCLRKMSQGLCNESRLVRDWKHIRKC